MPEDTLLALLSRAGPTMWPLVLCSVTALAVTLYKAAQFAADRVERSEALAVLEQPLDTWAFDTTCPLGRVLDAVARAAPEHRRLEAERAGALELSRYDAWLPVLSYVAQVAPLFGLLGTVVGMVQLFADMEAAGDAVSTATLSSGIWQALLTTAVGLIIAIPTIGAHLWFSRRVDRLQRRIEVGVGRLLVRAP